MAVRFEIAIWMGGTRDQMWKTWVAGARRRSADEIIAEYLFRSALDFEVGIFAARNLDTMT